MTSFHPTIIASILSVSVASPVVFANTSCNVNLSAGFAIQTNSIEFLQAEGADGTQERRLYSILDGKKLLVNNQEVQLSDEQQALVKKYDGQIRHLVPQVKNVAIEGVDLAIEGVNLAFNGLLGEGNAVAADLTTELTLIREQVATNLSIENGVSVGVEGLESEGLLGKDFDKRIESVVEKAVLNSMGSILIAMGQQMMASGGDQENFETRMENFGENIEHEMTTRSAVIEKKAEALCSSIVEVDALEEQLKREIKPLARINIFTVTQTHHEEKPNPTKM